MKNNPTASCCKSFGFTTCCKYLLSLATLFLVFSWPCNAVAADDDYLKALEAEAETINLDSANDSPTSETEAKAEPQKTESSTSSSQRMEFEHALRESLPRSYNSYTKLNAQNQDDVVQTYFDNSKNLQVAVKRLFELYFRQKKASK